MIPLGSFHQNRGLDTAVETREASELGQRLACPDSKLIDSQRRTLRS